MLTHTSLDRISEDVRSKLRIEYTIGSHLGVSEGARYIQDISGKVIEQDDNREDTRTVGKIWALRFLLGRARQNGLNALQVFDREVETMALGEDLYEPRKWELKSEILNRYNYDIIESDLLVLNYIELDPPFRGKDIGKYMIRDLYNNFIAGCGLFVLNFNPARIQPMGDVQKAIKKLGFYFSTVGFDTIPAFSDEYRFIHAGNGNKSFDAIHLD